MELRSTAMELLPLVCLCLLTWSGTTFADGNDPGVIRVVVFEDDDAVLPCSFGSVNIEHQVFDWKKDGQEVFIYDSGRTYGDGLSGQDKQFEGRVEHFPDLLKSGNASIVIRRTEVTDSGSYTCDSVQNGVSTTQSRIELIVDPVLIEGRPLILAAAPEPYVTILDQTNDRALLQCEVRGIFLKPEVEWQDSSGNILPAEEPQVSERGGRYSLQTTVTKTDRYRCVVTQEEINHQVHSETFVFMNGAAPKPRIKTINETKDWVLLQCEVQGAFPKPEVQWQDSSGNILPAEEPQVSERGGRYDITLQTTVTETDTYRCVATQEEINHQTFDEALVRVYVSECKTGWIVRTSLGILLIVVCVLTVLKANGCFNCNKDPPTKTRVPTEDSSHSEQQLDQGS
ncbi:hemicentin-1 isoform X2 [Lates calcarifer]|uniref:Hemicentin-1 isoform X2 n=2 Tax=Lates calcarifer TaxID=8187 RepID=A0AAJ8B321_LATCA|nr:hemicentin-1 isoform X2 [Lates calcarifer]